MICRKISWSDVPTELLSDIAGRLDTRSDILHFRAVCHIWRKSAPVSLLAGKTTILSPILPHRFSGNVSLYYAAPLYHTKKPLILVASSVFLLRSIANPNLPPWLFTVEEFNPGKFYLRRPLSRSNCDVLPQNFHNNLDLSRFLVSEIGRLYTLSFVPEFNDKMYTSKKRDPFLFKKVILNVTSSKCGSMNAPRIDDCVLMLLYNDVSDGSLAKLRLKNRGFFTLSRQGVKKFDDVVNFKGGVCAIDRKGRVYREVNGVLGSMIVDEPVGEGLGSDRKKLLVELCGELYLVYRCPRYAGVTFKVYKVNEVQKKWEELKGIGDDRILIATQDCCFFVPAKDVPTWRGNCLVFGKGVFPAYNSHKGADSEIFKSPEGTTLDIAVFHFGSGECKPIESYPGYSKVFWPPPAWLSSDTCLSQWSFQKDGEAEGNPDTLVQTCPESSGVKENSCTLGYQVDTQATDHFSLTDIQENLSAEGITTQVQPNATVVADSTPTTTGCNNAISKSLESGVSKMKFEGVDVRSDLLPTLKEIWAKHGNILEGHQIRSNDLVGWALESIAKVVILLQNTSNGTLSDSQADYLSSTLYDLQFMRLNVSWVVPSVIKALNMHKGVANREKLEGTLKEIEKVTTQVTDMKTKLLAEVNGLVQMLDEQRKTVCESLSVLDKLTASTEANL